MLSYYYKTVNEIHISYIAIKVQLYLNIAIESPIKNKEFKLIQKTFAKKQIKIDKI